MNRPTRSPFRGEQLPQEVSLGVFDRLAGAVLFLAPLAMAGRHPWGRLLYVGLVGCVTLTWLYRAACERRTLRLSGLEWVCFFGFVLIIVQSVPLPPSWRQMLSPEIDRILSSWRDDEGLTGSPWRTLSLSPATTREAGWILLAHFGWFTFWMQRLQNEADIRRTLRWIALSGCWIAAIGITQYLFGNGKFLWIYENPFRNATEVLRGPFYNENHCAHFLALTWPCLWWWMGRLPRCHRLFTANDSSTSRQGVRWGLGLALTGVLFAGALTRSRGGILTLLLAVMVGVLLDARGTPDRDRRWPRLLLIGAVVCVALMVHGWSEVSAEVATLTTASLDEIDQHGARRALWSAAWRLGQAFPLLGVGVGGFRETYPLHYDPPQHVDYTYAESGFLHILAETGFCGFVLLLGCLASIGTRWWTAWRRTFQHPGCRAELATCGTALLVSGFHSLFDFVWFIPACFSVTLVLLACVLRIGQLEPGQRSRPSQTGSIRIGPLAWQVTLMLTVIAIAQLLPAARASVPWERYLRMVHDESPEASGNLSATTDLETIVDLRRLLEQTVALDRRHARARVRLSGICLREFEMRQEASDNPMALSQIREAAWASRFKTKAAQDAWIDTVVGKRRLLLERAAYHARRSIGCAPLQGDAYQYLGELAFLTDPRPQLQERWLEQALATRPHSGSLLFSAGQQAILQGDVPKGLARWKSAYLTDPSFRIQIARQLLGRIPIQLFLDQFEPGLADLVTLHQQCEVTHERFDAAQLAKRYVDLIFADSPEGRTGEQWQQAYSFATKIGDPRAARCATEAVRIDPENYTMRRRLAMEYFAAEKFPEAIVQLEWCLRQTPRDQGLNGKLAMARERCEIQR